MSSPARRVWSAAIRVSRHVAQRFRWGRRAPGPSEIIDVDPRAVDGYLAVEMAREASPVAGRYGFIVGGDWDTRVPHTDVAATDVYVSCHLRWVEARRWEDTPVFQHYQARMERGERSRFRSDQELLSRYTTLDTVFEHALRTRSLSERREHLVLMSVGRDGRLIHGPDGRHRLVIALIADLETMPARVGFVHCAGIGHFQVLRRR